MERKSASTAQKEPARPKNALQVALFRLANRVSYDRPNSCYRLDGRPARVQDIIKEAQSLR